MAYTTSNPPRLTTYAGLTGRGQTWEYLSTDALAVVVATNYISNAADLGMQTGDIILIIDYDAPTAAWARLTRVTATGTIMSAGLPIT